MSKFGLIRTKSFLAVLGGVFLLSLGLAFAVDSDSDGMSDLYENFFKLNATNETDAAENYDTDSLSNLQEAGLWTDPDIADTDTDGFADDVDSNALSRAVIRWGDPSFTSGDVYSYTGPQWWLGAGKDGGEWSTNSSWSVAASESGALYIDVDRSMLTNNLMLELRYLNASNAVASFDLLDADLSPVATNLHGNILTGSGEPEYNRFTIPLTNFPSASRLVLQVHAGAEPFEAFTSILSIDDDTDGLDADQEIQVGTSDLNQDCDDDGLTDYAEVMISGTDPLLWDTDTDGLSDGEELLASRYQFIPGRYTIEEARTLAALLGGYLARITTQEEHDALLARFPALVSERLGPWIGLNDEVEEGVFVWEDGTPLDFDAWQDGEPNNSRGRADNVQYQFGEWIDSYHALRTSALIEYGQSLNPLNPDTDGDTLTDGEELNDYLSSPYVADSDGDGLSDAQEVELGTSMISSDSDEDGLSDAEELARGTDALDADSDDDGLLDGDEINHFYHLVLDRISWLDAKVGAELQGGHLAVINSQEEQDILFASLLGEAVKANHPWLGATDEVEEGVWRWITDESFDFENWYANQPSDADGEDYLHYYKGLFDDHTSSKKNTYLIEYAESLNPLVADSDGDGVNDGDEVNLYGTNPHYFEDTDGDGLSDAAEMANNYYVVQDKMVWHDAKVDAERQGGYLAVINSQVELDKVFAVLGSNTVMTSRLWLGATDELEEGVWSWVTGESFDFWNGTGPSGTYKGEEEHYLECYKGVWNDASATLKFESLVEYTNSLNPLVADSDGDGVNDGDEVNLYGSNPHCADTDGDGLSDLDEVAIGSNLLMTDTDRDGLSDSEEVVIGLNPCLSDTDGDLLSDNNERLITGTNPLEMDSNTNGFPDAIMVQQVNGADYIDRVQPHITAVWETTNTSVTVATVLTIKHSITYQMLVDQDDMYQLRVLAETTNGADIDELNVAIAIDGCDVGSAVGYLKDGVIEYALFTPWLITGAHTVEVTVSRNKEEHFGATIHSIKLDAIDGMDADNDGVEDWVSERFAAQSDSDGDGIADWDELQLGSDLLDADTDGDGLNDNDELAAGTDILNADSDGDGVNDGAEVYGALTDPLTAEFDGTITAVDNCSGAAVDGTLGNWTAEGSELKIDSVRGHVEYALNFPANDMMRLVVKAAHEWNKSSCTPVIPIDESAFLIFVDDIYVGKFPMVSADGVYVDVQAFLPVLPAGEHTVRLYWENVYSRLAVKIQSLELQSLGGSDANSNGTKDWIEASIKAMAGVDTVTESYVSPACIEGDARYVELMEILGGTTSSSSADNGDIVPPQKGTGPRWYANLPLDQDDTTTATAFFQNGALELPINIDWVAYNLMDHDGDTLYVRAGDMVKFVALPDEANGGQFEIEYTLGMDGETVRSPNTRPLIYQFPSAGSYTVSGEYTHGNDTVSASIQVVAIDGSFPEENPACLVGKERTWSFGGMSSNVTFEVDSTVEMSIVEQSLTTNNNQQTTVALRANDTNGDHTMLARLYEGGPILDATKLDTFWVQNAVDGYFYTVERYEDSELWEVRSVAKNVPDTVDLQIKVIIGGVSLDDYTLERWITNDSYNDIGEYKFRLFHPNDEEASTCHTFKLYQDGEFLGEAF